MNSPEDLVFGANKYAAFNLILARWLAIGGASQENYVYVTMGGTELYDVANICWIKDDLIGSIVTYEQDPARFKRAKRMAGRLCGRGLKVSARQEDYFAYSRDVDAPHAFFADITGPFHQQYIASIRRWLTEDVLRPGDFLLITSYQGRNIGYERLLNGFSDEFLVLGVTEANVQKDLYKAAHPAFVLYSALEQGGFQNEISIRSIGMVRYHDTSPMGLYAFTCADGKTDLHALVEGTRVFNSVKRSWNVVSIP